MEHLLSIRLKLQVMKRAPLTFQGMCVWGGIKAFPDKACNLPHNNIYLCCLLCLFAFQFIVAFSLFDNRKMSFI